MGEQLPTLQPVEAALVDDVCRLLPYTPTSDQHTLIHTAAQFVCRPTSTGVLVINGYAGTGKTSVVGALVKVLTERRQPCVLMAPTGRAAHIFGLAASHRAYTIHRRIYRQQSYGSDSYSVAQNSQAGTLFIVDEASMIANGSDGIVFGSGRLLDDLIHYVYAAGNGSRLILMGDGAQLPPVGCTGSPALDAATLAAYGLQVTTVTLREVARQSLDSGILHNATLLRQAIEAGPTMRPALSCDGWDDITALNGEMFLETLSDCYSRDGADQTIIITRSNRMAALYNMGIRARVLYREDMFDGGEALIVTKNNYYWAQDYKQIDFIANGDVLHVERMRGEEESRYGLRFATLTVTLPDHDDIEMEVKVVTDGLVSDAPRPHPRTKRAPFQRGVGGTHWRQTRTLPPTQAAPLLQRPTSKIRLRRHLPQGPRRPMGKRLHRHGRHRPRGPSHPRLPPLALHRPHPAPHTPHPTSSTTSPSDES